MSDERAFTLASDDGAVLHGVVHTPERDGPRPTVVLCHGFKGFMEWGFFPPLAELLAARGFTVVRFNYSGCGQQPGEDRVSDLDAFRANHHSRELAETLRVLDALGGEIGAGRVDPARVGLFGHSRGGGAALLAAAHRRIEGRLAALVTWAAVGTFQRYDQATRARWRRDGELPILNGRTGQTLPLGVGLLDDLERNRDALDLAAAAGRCQAPWLIVHGSADETVDVAEARGLDVHAGGEHQLLLVEGAGHTFGAVHPFAGPTPALIEVMNATQTWFRRHLG